MFYLLFPAAFSPPPSLSPPCCSGNATDSPWRIPLIPQLGVGFDGHRQGLLQTSGQGRIRKFSFPFPPTALCWKRFPPRCAKSAFCSKTTAGLEHPRWKNIQLFPGKVGSSSSLVSQHPKFGIHGEMIQCLPRAAGGVLSRAGHWNPCGFLPARDIPRFHSRDLFNGMKREGTLSLHPAAGRQESDARAGGQGGVRAKCSPWLQVFGCPGKKRNLWLRQNLSNPLPPPPRPPRSLSVHQLSWMSATNHSTNSCRASGLGKFSFKNMNSQYNEATER